jgi:hypothetical protein
MKWQDHLPTDLASWASIATIVVVPFAILSFVFAVWALVVAYSQLSSANYSLTKSIETFTAANSVTLLLATNELTSEYAALTASTPSDENRKKAFYTNFYKLVISALYYSDKGFIDQNVAKSLIDTFCDLYRRDKDFVSYWSEHKNDTNFNVIDSRFATIGSQCLYPKG